MKKLVALVLSLMLVLSVFAISAGAEAKEINVAYLAKNTVDAFHATLNSAAKEALDALVADGTIAKWQLYDGLTDPITQVNLIEDAINNGANFVILLPAESQGSAPVVTRCQEAGIPIVVINSKTNNTDELANAFVGSNDVQAGEMMAQFVQQQLPDGGKYRAHDGHRGQLRADRPRPGHQEHHGARMPSGQAVGDFAADWSADKAVQFATDAVSKYGAELKAIICDNDDMSSAVQAYCNSVERTDIVCIGVDGNKGPMTMVKQGALKATDPAGWRRSGQSAASP